MRSHGPLPLPQTDVHQNWFVPLSTRSQVDGGASHHADGSTPVRLLSFTLKYVTLVNALNSAGTVPVRRLEYRYL